MPSHTALVKTALANVPQAAAGKVNLFVDLADNLLKGRTELPPGPGDVIIYDSAISSGLGNVSANPALLDTSLEPSAIGQMWVVSVVGPPHRAELVSAEEFGISRTTNTQQPPLVASGAVVLGEFVQVDLVTAAADVDVLLPPVGAGDVDREIWVKINSLGFPSNGFKVVLVPDGADTIDGLAAGGGGHLELLTNFEWRKLRVLAAGVWGVVG
jgi:hypothetical protein